MQFTPARFVCYTYVDGQTDKPVDAQEQVVNQLIGLNHVHIC